MTILSDPRVYLRGEVVRVQEPAEIGGTIFWQGAVPRGDTAALAACLAATPEGHRAFVSRAIADRDAGPRPAPGEADGGRDGPEVDVPDWPAPPDPARQNENEPPEEPRAVAVPLNTIERREVDWLWRGWLPRGAVITLAGEPGVGKSFLLAAVATAITLGVPLPGDATPRAPAPVLLVASEDDEAAVLRPRFEAMGADLATIFVRTEVRDEDGPRPVILPQDGELLGELVRQIRPALVVIDPLVAVEDPRLDTHKQAAQRAVFTPLQRLAAEMGCAVVVVCHTRKSAAETAAHRIMGSIDVVAAARVVWAVGADPDNPARRGLAVAKTNLGAFPDPRAFSIAPDGRFGWERDAAPELNADRLFSLPADGEERGARDEAVGFLREALDDGPRPCREVQREARGAGISERTLDRAKIALGVKSGKEGSGPWLWRLPSQGCQDPSTEIGGTLGTLPSSPYVSGIPERVPRVPLMYIGGVWHPSPENAASPAAPSVYSVVRSARDRLRAEQGREPTPREIADAADIDPFRTAEALAVLDAQR